MQNRFLTFALRKLFKTFAFVIAMDERLKHANDLIEIINAALVNLKISNGGVKLDYSGPEHECLIVWADKPTGVVAGVFDLYRVYGPSSSSVAVKERQYTAGTEPPNVIVNQVRQLDEVRRAVRDWYREVNPEEGKEHAKWESYMQEQGGA